MIKTFRAFIKKHIKYFFYVALILALKEWADFLRGDDLDLLRLIGNTALAFYFWGLFGAYSGAHPGQKGPGFMVPQAGLAQIALQKGLREGPK